MNNEGLNHNNDSNPEHTERAKNAFIDMFNKIAGRQEDENTYEFVDDPAQVSTDPMDYIKEVKAIDAEHTFGPLKEVPTGEHSLPRSEQDVQDATRVLMRPLTGDQLIQSIDEAQKPPAEN